MIARNDSSRHFAWYRLALRAEPISRLSILLTVCAGPPIFVPSDLGRNPARTGSLSQLFQEDDALHAWEPDHAAAEDNSADSSAQGLVDSG